MARPRTHPRTGRGGTMSSNGTIAVGSTEAGMMPRILLGAVNGVEIAAAGALQLTRDLLVTTVSGIADIGAEALNATAGGVRGIVSAASRMVGDIAGTAQGTFWAAFDNARHARLRAAHMALRRPPSPAIIGFAQVPAPERRAAVSHSRRGVKRPRAAARPSRATAAA